MLETGITKILKDRNISIKKLSEDTGIKYMSLYYSLSRNARRRELRAKEFLKICEYLNVNPFKVDKN